MKQRKPPLFSRHATSVAAALILTLATSRPTAAQSTVLDSVRFDLLNNPPGIGDESIRKKAIRRLDAVLGEEDANTSEAVIAFYDSMMAKVATEIMESVPSGVAIWMMSNHGFVVQTPETVFAFEWRLT
jgi:hypothetical protein